jgi:hypothetical protein
MKLPAADRLRVVLGIATLVAAARWWEGRLPLDNGAFADDCTNDIANEGALDYNAGFTGAPAALAAEHGGRPLDDFPPK